MKRGAIFILVFIGAILSSKMSYGGAIFSEDFTTDPQWASDEPSNVKWDAAGFYRAKVTDDPSGFAQWGHSPLFQEVSDASFSLEFDVNTIDPSYGTYPGLQLIAEGVSNPFANQSPDIEVDIADEFPGNFVMRGKPYGGSSPIYFSSPQFTEGQWYHQRVDYDSETDTLNWQISLVGMPDGSFYSATHTNILVAPFDQVVVGYESTPPVYGSWAEIYVDNITVLTPLTLLRPNGGEAWVAGKTQDIQWEAALDANIPEVKIEYSDSNGQSWSLIDANTANDGKYDWLVPEVTSPNCLVRISDANDANVYDTSDDVFTIFKCLERFAGDLNGDCQVDFYDFALFSQDWLKQGHQWFEYNGHHYALTLIYGTWDQAEAEAIVAGGHLVTVNNEEENSWLFSTFYSEDYLWIGFYQLPGSPEPAGGWVWVSGEPVTYIGWRGQEPNNQYPGEDYAVFREDGGWNDWGPEKYDFYPIRGIVEVP